MGDVILPADADYTPVKVLGSIRFHTVAVQ